MSNQEQDKKTSQNAVDSYEEVQEEPYQTEEYLYSHEYTRQHHDKTFEQILFEKNFLQELASMQYNIDDGIFLSNNQNQNLTNGYWNKKIDKAFDELQNLSFAIDYGSIDFQQKFFAKYILIKSPTANSEKEKAETLQVKVTTQKLKKDIYITQNEMGEHLSQFRTIYQQFVKIQSYLSQQAIQQFNKYFDFEFFIILEDTIKGTLIVNQTNHSFLIQWGLIGHHGNIVPYNIKPEQTDQDLSQDFYVDYVQLLLSNNIYQSYKDVTGYQDLSISNIIGLVMQAHQELFQFLLKVKITNMPEKITIVQINQKIIYIFCYQYTEVFYWLNFFIIMLRKLVRNQQFILNKTQFRLQGQSDCSRHRGLKTSMETPPYMFFYQKLQNESSSLFNKIDIDIHISNVTLPNFAIYENNEGYKMKSKSKKQGLKKRRKRRYGRLIDMQIGQKRNSPLEQRDKEIKQEDLESQKQKNKKQ